MFSLWGSGSDYTSFIDHLGVPSIDLSFEDADVIATYHSETDDFYWENRFGAFGRYSLFFFRLLLPSLSLF